jgi:hypothetical protein
MMNCPFDQASLILYLSLVFVSFVGKDSPARIKSDDQIRHLLAKPIRSGGRFVYIANQRKQMVSSADALCSFLKN